MKGVPIKFRAKDSVTGEYIFGRAIIPYENRILLGNHTKALFTEVDFNSVAQLIGYDAVENEVYEDDKLILGSHEYIAGIRPFSYTDDKKYYKPEKDFSDFLLNEV